MTSSKKFAGLTRFRAVIARFVSWIQESRVWYDIHLPLTPQVLRSDRPALPNQRSLATFMMPGQDE